MTSHHLIDSLVWHTDRTGQRLLSNAEGDEELLEQHLSRMRRLAVGWYAHHLGSPLVVIGYLDFARRGVIP